MLAAGQRVALRGNANVSTGGTPSNVMPQVHADVRALAECVAINVGLDVVGVDFITTDISRSWREVGGAVVEVNRAPGMDLHIAEGSRSEEQLGRIVLGDGIGRVPLVVVVCDDAAHEALIDALRASQALPAHTALLGAAHTAWGDLQLATADRPAFWRLRQALAHRQCAAAVLAINMHEISRHGFPADRAALTVWADAATTPAAEAALDVATSASDALLVVRAEPSAGWPTASAVDAIVKALAAGDVTAASSLAKVPRAAPRTQREALRTIKAHRDSGGPALVAIMRNEAWLAPFFFAHYRALGVENFHIFDDHSDDGTREFLLAQDDCTVLDAAMGFAERAANGQPFHHLLRNLIPHSLGAQRWVLTVDADEFLILPPPFQNVHELYGHLERQQHRCVLAGMVDFYPARLRDRHAARDVSPFDACPYFDAERSFVRPADDGPMQKRAGGVRARLQARLRERDPAQYAAIYQDRGYAMAAMWKTPLIKTGIGVFLKNSHTSNVNPPRDIELALAHFKFGRDLDAKIANALASKSYFLGSIEYRFLAAALQHFEDDDLRGPQSRRFSGAQSLHDAGLLFCRDAMPQR